MTDARDQQTSGSRPDAAAAVDVPATPPRPSTSVRWLTLTVVVVGLGAGVLWHYGREWSLRKQIPSVDLQDVNSEVARLIRTSTEAVQRRPRSGEAWGQLGMVLHAHEYYTEAIVCYQHAGQQEPREFRWPYYLANLLERDDRPAAVTAFRQAVEIEPAIAQLRIGLAEALVELGETAVAEREFQVALELAPQNGQAQFRLAQLLFSRRDFSASLPWAQKAAEHKPPRRDVHELLAQLYHRLGQQEQATEQTKLLRTAAFSGGYWPDPYFDQLKELRRDPLWMAYQANVLLHSGQAAESLAMLAALVEQHPQEVAPREQLARAFVHVQMLDRAAEVLDEGLQLTPRSFELHRLRGAVHILLQEWSPAIQQYAAALQAKSDDAAAHFDLGYCLVQHGETERGLTEFREAIRYQPDFVEPRLEIARALLKQGETQAAAAELKPVLDLAPQNATAHELLKKAMESSSPATVPDKK